ncbi:LacI family DNA-binding transcriptional regulator [Paenibacillus mendelii]|uniref:LacI family DNA-binding transcriptional regulator n=1 Tax=Paenibacillus mendelii TaxID=206163 RepID=A0ABV6JAE6_9BACL|nr:substrate-binding domain-containing protein [Paenibacillus mendelii]MCQ6560752.1 substrate-binding domain-containing protein [Paenibacillus mendelii]
MSATLKDIAKKAGVSVTTVSRVVNHQDTSICSEETQSLIWKLVKEVGYNPKKKNRPHQDSETELRIGYVLGSSTEQHHDPYYSQVLRGIEHEALLSGVHIPFGCFTPDLYQPEVFERILEESKVGAVIYMSYSPLLEVLRGRRDIHTILAGIELEGALPGSDYVGVDLYGESRKWIMDKLMHTFEHVGYIGYEATVRYQAYKDAHKLMERPINPGYSIFAKDWSTDAAKLAVTAFLEGGGKLPQAFFCASDIQAIGGMLALRQHNIRVPEDVQVLGFDNVEMSSYVSPPLSTIDVPKFNIGRSAVKMAIERIRGERDYPINVTMPTAYVQRESLK